MTIEDPIEYQLRGISQLQVNSKIELTFAAGLRSVASPSAIAQSLVVHNCFPYSHVIGKER